MQACRLRSHTVDVAPPQAAAKIMAGMAEQQTEWRNWGMADGMVKWWEWSNGGNGRQNGRMADRNGYIRTIYGTHRHRRLAGMGERQKEWQNGRMAEMATYVLFMVHTDTDDDTDTF